MWIPSTLGSKSKSHSKIETNEIQPINRRSQREVIQKGTKISMQLEMYIITL